MGVKSKTLVLCLGNPLMGDDGAGVAVARMLKKLGLPPSVDLLEGEIDGLYFLGLAEGYDKIIVVDAAEMNLEPGTWKAFDAAPELLKGNSGLSTHQFGLGEALRLAEKLKLPLPPIKVYGIQPQSIRFTGKMQLTGAVARAVRSVAEVLHKELTASQLAGSFPLSRETKRVPD
ncbi:MAG: hydrogenase maturation protease [Anaerolineae bacterium]|nr:hydrogenase maturation protease [Anaerolineae bacterium]